MNRNWLGKLSNYTKLSDIAIPATHNSSTSHKVFSILNPFSKCQGLSIEKQLMIGVRYFDIRVSFNSKLELITKHGISKNEISLEEVIYELWTFLTFNPSEFIMISFQNEDAKKLNSYITPYHRGDTYQRAIKIILKRYGIEYLEGVSYDTELNKVRGKIIITDYIDFDTVDAPLFPRLVSDYCFYMKSTEENVIRKINGVKYLMSRSNADESYLQYNCYSHGSFPVLGFLPYPKSFSKLINPRLAEILRNRLVKTRGIFMVDFMDEQLADLIINQNFNR